MENIESATMSVDDKNIFTTYDKGREMEIAFSVFMKKELNWKDVRVGAHLPQKMNRKGAAVDVISERLDARGKSFHNLSMIAIFISIFFLVISLCFLFLDGDEETGVGLLIIAIVCIGFAFLYMRTSDKFNKENGWVECKNLKGKANITQIDKSLREYREYLNSADTEYKFKYHYFVSANGYIENALKYALENGIICYEKDGDSFKKAEYWN